MKSNFSGAPVIGRATAKLSAEDRDDGLCGRLKRIRPGVYEFGYRPTGKNAVAKLGYIMPRASFSYLAWNGESSHGICSAGSSVG
jgi:hypothetical protein